MATLRCYAPCAARGAPSGVPFSADTLEGGSAADYRYVPLVCQTEECLLVDPEQTAKRKPAISPHIRGHLLLFHPWSPPEWGRSTGIRLLVAAVMVELVRVVGIRLLRSEVPLWILSPLFLAIGLFAVRWIVGLKFSQIGYRLWRDWTVTEKSYFLQVFLLANVVFLVILGASLGKRLEEYSAVWVVWNVFIPYLFFGFYQELVYRGMVQLELVRRWGPVTGILVANLLYTFGPLHWTYLSSQVTIAAPMFAGVFLIGLFFGILFRRSGNLFIVATLHAIGNAYIVSSLNSIG